MIDLHIHSTASDGQYSPGELVKMAKSQGITAIALTDHDTVAGLREAQEAAEQAGITFVPGIEISVKTEGVGGEFHILGYGIHPEHPVIQAMCSRFIALRSQREDKIFDFLAERGVSLTREQVECYAANGLVARPHFARAMVKAGYVSTVREAFDRYLAIPEFDRIERPKPSPEEGIHSILDAGGIPVLAHPVQLGLAEDALERLLRNLKKAGMKGVECYYSTHTPEQTRSFLSMAQKEGLIITGGSDFHGEKVKADIALGTGIKDSLRVPDDLAEILLKKIKSEREKKR